MKKKLLSAALAVCLMFGSAAALPEAFWDDSASISASAASESDFTYKALDGSTCVVTACSITGQQDNVEIPKTLGGLTVVQIGDLDTYAMPFAYKNFKTVTIPDTVKKIDNNAFEGSQITSIALPKSLEKFLKGAFVNCSKLASISIDSSNANYTSYKGVLYNKAKTEVVFVPEGITSVTIPGTLKTVPKAHYKSGSESDSVYRTTFIKQPSLTSVTIEEGVTSIGAAAFADCPNLMTITVPKSVTSIGEQAFGYQRDSQNFLNKISNYSNITIKGYTGSAAETYAKNNGLKFEAIGTSCSGHVYGEPTWTWASGHASATATFACTKCGNKQTVTGKASVASTSQSCEQPAKEVYKVTITFNNKSYSTSYTVTGASATGHKWGNWTVTKPATTTAKGEEKRTCSACGKTETREIPMVTHTHSYTTKTVAPKCTEQGYTLHSCSCGYSYKDNYKAALGHDWGSWTTQKAATCTEDGVQICKCKRSGCTASQTQTAAKLGHNYSQTVTKPTCTAQGYTTYSCSRCSNSYKSDYTNALGHNWGEWVTTKKPTTTTTGTMQRSCTVCGTKETQTIPVTTHTHTYTTKVVAPTCTQRGYTLHTCSGCGNKYEDNYKAALGHNYGDWTTTKAATCTADGVETCKCKRCTATQTRTISKLGHNWGSWTVTKAATCKEAGVETRSCTRSGCTVKETRSIQKTDHSWGAWTVTRKATEKTTGEKVRTCSVCGKKETATIPVTTHKHSYTTKVVAPTCTQQGYTLHTCKTCGDSYKDTYTKALGHSFKTTVVSPTCKSEGYTLHKCTRSGCNYSYKTNTTAKVDHSWNAWTVTKKATATSTGTKTRTCKVCGKKETAVIPVTTHKHSYTTKVVAPTCTAKGYTLHTCSACGDSYKDTYKNALGHSEKKTVVSATVTKEGYTLHKCTRAGCNYSYTDSKTPKISIRMFGSDRFQTSFKIADQFKKEKGGKAFTNVIVASGMDFADALSATYLAKVKNAPIILTANSMTDSVVSYIKKNSAKGANVYIIGGNKAVSASMDKKLSGCKVIRLSGSDRFETNIKVLKEAKVTNQEIIFASGMNYADALSASAAGRPIMLVAGNSLTKNQTAYLKTLKGKTATIVGGVSAVSKKIQTQISKGYSFKTVRRIGGQDRFETSVNIAKTYFKNPPTIALAYGINFPDGLCGGVLALTYKCPLILTMNTNTTAAKKYATSMNATNTVTFGGYKLISDAALKTILGK